MSVLVHRQPAAEVPGLAYYTPLSAVARRACTDRPVRALEALDLMYGYYCAQ